ncbi:MAG: DNA polymerase III subunit delta [Clostridia bacterium]|nr:DNA polymerase III subunit delta [Clostridia bacterium]
MDIVYENQIKNDIKRGALSPVYVLFGEDSYLKKHYTDKIVDAVCNGDTDFNLQVFEQSANMQNVYEAVNQFPMMSDKRCVVINDYDYEHADKDELERLYQILADIPSTTVLVLRFDSVPFEHKKNTKAKKIIANAEKSGGRAVMLGHREQGDLVSMLVRGAKKRGASISVDNAKYLINITGEDINSLTNEIDKLCLFVENGEITKENIDFVSSKTIDASVYDYVKQIIALNITAALGILDDMFYMHVEPIAILYSISSCYVDMYRLFALNAAGKSREELIEDFSYGNRSFVVGNAAYNLKKFNQKKLNDSLVLLLKTDTELKSMSGGERIILEELTVKLARIIASEDKL